MSTHEPTARSAEKTFPSDAEVIDSVFITPRVIDQGAFREYADSLKGLIREAGGRRTELRTDAEEARQLRENLSEAANRLRERLETTAKLLPVLDNRVRRAEEAMARAEDEANLPALLEERIGRHVTALEARLREALASADERVAAIEARYGELQRRAESDLARLESVGAQLSASAAGAGEALAGAEERTRVLRGEIEQMTAHACSSLGESVSEVLARADERLAVIDSQIAPFLEAAESVPAAMRAHVERAIETINGHAAEALKRAEAVEMLSERAVRILGFDPDRPDDDIAPDSLMMLVQRGDQLERTARATAEELAALHAAGAETAERLEAAGRDSDETVARLVSRREELTAAIDGALATLGGEADEFLERVVAAQKQLAQVEQRRRRVGQGMGDLSGELAAMEARLTETLASLRAASTEELARLQQAVVVQRRSLSDAAAGGEAGASHS